MTLRDIDAQHEAVRDDIGELVTRRALPTPSIQMVDPFLFLNHHGPQVYPPGNQGLPFAPHPHRGFETVTFILAGDVAHKDSGGHESVIGAGGVQWMTAGRGLVHEEVSSREFKQRGGELEILQLWVNLPKALKMTTPNYVGLQREEIPSMVEDGGRVKVYVISGRWGDAEGAFRPLCDIQMFRAVLSQGGQLYFAVPPERNIFFYVVRGLVNVNGRDVAEYNLVEFKNQGEGISIKTREGAELLVGHALPFKEPVASYGPFVMNTKAEILQAIQDYEEGQFD